tara:strand:+ start:277 stop:504 length:228 start_codon:yes stop_codon:yes gene_type:complete
VESNSKFNGVQAVINYSLNKFCPLIIVAFLVFSNFELTRWEPYVIMLLIFFIERFSFKVGYSVAYCECKGIDTNG